MSGGMCATEENKAGPEDEESEASGFLYVRGLGMSVEQKPEADEREREPCGHPGHEYCR